MTESEAAARNLETVRRYLPGRYDEPWFEVLPELFDPRCDHYPPLGSPEPDPRHGIKEISAYLREWRSAWEDLRTEVDVTAPDDVRVLARLHISAKGYSSGMDLEQDTFHCFWLRHGRIIRIEDHLTERGARHALGLAEDGE